jgi:hypothetical protein
VTLQDAAVEVLCVDVAVREAMKRIGDPCVADRTIASAEATSSVAVAAPKSAPLKKPASVAMVIPKTRTVAPQTTIPTAATTPIKHPDWCNTASAEQRRANKSCSD